MSARRWPSPLLSHAIENVEREAPQPKKGVAHVETAEEMGAGHLGAGMMPRAPFVHDGFDAMAAIHLAMAAKAVMSFSMTVGPLPARRTNHPP